MTSEVTQADRIADELKALSKAATQGVCEVLAPDTEHDFGVPLVATDYPGTFGPTNGMVLWAAMQPTEIDAKDTSLAEANAAFTAALWNLYRQGQLILVDDAAVERVAELQLAAFLAGRGSVTSMKNGTRSAKPAPTMDQFRQMAIAAMGANP